MILFPCAVQGNAKKGAILSRERMAPFIHRSPRAAPVSPPKKGEFSKIK